MRIFQEPTAVEDIPQVLSCDHVCQPKFRKICYLKENGLLQYFILIWYIRVTVFY